MLSYCLKCRKKQTVKTMLSTKCAVCDSKKSKFIKEQEACQLLSNLGIKTPLSKFSILGNILF